MASAGDAAMRRTLATLVALATLGVGSTASAHPLDLGYLRITQSGDELSVSLGISADAAAGLLDADHVDAATVTARASELAAASYALAPITTDDGPCTWGPASAVLHDATVDIASTATCAGTGERRWTFLAVRDDLISSGFQLLVKETVGHSERLTLIDGSNDSMVLGAATAGSSVGFSAFVWSGIEHIGVAPAEWREPDGGLRLPDGIDHILFLIGLMLGGGRLLQLVGIASGFTLGHSITLAIAALGIVRPPSEVIEPLIALSIALVAVEAFTGVFHKHRWKIATGFGLVHGFGFANALTELDLSTRGMVTALFGYNLGVELGQVAIVLVVAPLILLAHRDKRFGTYVVKAIACVIFVLGMSWFFERACGW